jgi:hypothetical protein
MSLTSARTTPANDGVNIGGALRHVRFSTTRKQRNAAPGCEDRNATAFNIPTWR